MNITTARHGLTVEASVDDRIVVATARPLMVQRADPRSAGLLYEWAIAIEVSRMSLTVDHDLSAMMKAACSAVIDALSEAS